MLLGRSEVALLDVREARAYVGGHLSLARLAPLSSLELEVSALVPRLGTPIVLVDAGDSPGPAPSAAALLERLGYRDVCMLAGGTTGWAAADLPLVDGYGALVKAFGDTVRQRHSTPTLSGGVVRARQASGEALMLIDARPADEYAFLSVVGAANHPGTELALRQWSNDPSGAPWVINCFSRTRGIIATTTLRLLGHPDAHFLEDGVMRWALDEAPVVMNAQAAHTLPAASEAELRQRADALIEGHGLPLVREDELQHLRADPDRTLYIFDLRPEAMGAQPGGACAVPGGQLLMHFENLVGTRNARIVLIDDPHRLRAAVTAFWLLQLNQAEVSILEEPWLATGVATTGAVVEPAAAADEGLSPAQLALLLASAPGSLHLVDVGPSFDFERQHLPGAHFLLPWSLDPLADLQHAGHRIVFSSPDGQAARLAARNARERWPESDATWLAGGTRAWQAAGFPIEQAWQPAQLLTPFDDDWGSVMRVPAARRDRAWAEYLAWERGLSERIARDPTVRFRFF